MRFIFAYKEPSRFQGESFKFQSVGPVNFPSHAQKATPKSYLCIIEDEFDTCPFKMDYKPII